MFMLHFKLLGTLWFGTTVASDFDENNNNTGLIGQFLVFKRKFPNQIYPSNIECWSCLKFTRVNIRLTWT